MLIKDPDIQPIFRMYIENILATSELNILKRLKAIETALELKLIDGMEGYEFEKCMKNVFEKLGYLVYHTPRSGIKVQISF